MPQEPKDVELLEEQRRDMHAIIYDELMKAIIKILRTVDLGLTAPAPVHAGEAAKSSEPSASLASDPLLAVTPKIPKDFQSFLNLVDFCKLILPRIYPHLFPRWACTYRSLWLTPSAQTFSCRHVHSRDYRKSKQTSSC